MRAHFHWLVEQQHQRHLYGQVRPLAHSFCSLKLKLSNRSPRIQRVAPAIVVAGAVAVAVVEGRHFLYYFLSFPRLCSLRPVQTCPVVGWA